MATEEVAAKAAEEAAKEPQSVEVLNSFISDPVGYITAHQDAIISVCTNLIYAVIILVIGWLVAKLFGSCKLSSSEISFSFFGRSVFYFEQIT